MKGILISKILLVLIICHIVLCSCTKPIINPEPKGEEFPLVDGGETISSIEAVNVRRVARVIGLTQPSDDTLPNPNNSLKRFGIASTDYGNMWDAGNGYVWCIFGDNFNDKGGNWRSNAIAFTNDTNLSDGLYYEDMLRDKNNNVKEIIVSRAKTGQYPNDDQHEVTCIPTGGVSVKTVGGNRQYINYMSIHQWDTQGKDKWAVNYSEIVYSDDYGTTWVRSGVKWDANSHFAQIAYLKKDGYIYMYGTQSGRYDSVHLARVTENNMLDKESYEYWNGEEWVYSEASAVAIANGTTSEFTVVYNSYYKRYIMMYLSVNQREVVYRDAASPEGEWSAEKVILSDGYGTYIHPLFNDGRDLWFVISTVTSNPSVNYNTWHIFLYNAKLKEDENGFNLVQESGFEEYPDKSITYRTLWNAEEAMTSHDAHSGDISCKITNDDSKVWKDACVQSVSVKKNTNYILTAYAKSSIDGHKTAYLGVRKPESKIEDINSPISKTEWTKITKEFNSGNNTSVNVFFGTWGATGLSICVDDIKLEPKK